MKYRVEPIFFYNKLKRQAKYFDFHLGVTLRSIGYRRGYKDFCLLIYLGFFWVELGFKLIPKWIANQERHGSYCHDCDKKDGMGEDDKMP